MTTLSAKETLKCYNHGCMADFSIYDNPEGSCQYHPGTPYFHDAYKGWTCCNKKSINFTEFLNIKGCTRGKHNPNKPKENENNLVSLENKKLDDADSVNNQPATAVPLDTKPIERPSADEVMTKLKVIVSSSLNMKLKNMKISTNSTSVVENSAEPSDIHIGTRCYNTGCNTEYDGKNRSSECRFHPGVAVFHEGLKYWSCCKKYSCDFSTFLAQPGCTYGTHLWYKKNENTVTNCRYDWHQTSESVTIVIYAKNYDVEATEILANQVRVSLRVYFPEDKASFDKVIDLFQAINTEKSSVTMSPTKIEIKLKKTSGTYWPDLEYKMN